MVRGEAPLGRPIVIGAGMGRLATRGHIEGTAMSNENDRAKRLLTLDEEIAAKIEADLKAGVLSKVPGFGKPLAADTGYEQTPEEWRMAFKILKNAGFAPPEVELMKVRAALQDERRACKDPSQCKALDDQIQDLSLRISFRMDRFKSYR